MRDGADAFDHGENTPRSGFVASVDTPASVQEFISFTSRHAAQAGMVVSVDPRLGRGPCFRNSKLSGPA